MFDVMVTSNKFEDWNARRVINVAVNHLNDIGDDNVMIRLVAMPRTDGIEAARLHAYKIHHGRQ